MRLLICDLDDTLIDRDRAFASWLAEFAKQHGFDKNVIRRFTQEDRHGFRGRREFFAIVNRHLRSPVDVGMLVEDFDSSIAGYFQPLSSEIADALTSLRGQGWKVAVVTNGSPAQLAKMEATGVVQCVDAWCISEVDGVRKPEPAIFQLAAHRCGVDLRYAWMIGDSAEADIGGAQAAGIRSAWLRRGRPWPLTAFRPTLIVDSVAEAVAQIRIIG
ncbi:MAG TPA: HAD family hydrolase [Candidatus Baltobacterales bacterium]|nr:HAD family hydrolase [Candidatus Baltobacterales bacterium]